MANTRMTYPKAEELWAEVLNRRTRKSFTLVSMDIVSGKAIYYLKTSLNPEYIASRFRLAGAYRVSSRRIWGEKKVYVEVDHFVPPHVDVNPVTIDDLVEAYAVANRSN